MSLRFFSIVAVAAFGLASSALAGEVLDRVNQKKTLVVAVDTGIQPTSFLNKNNEMDGFDIEVAKDLAKRLGAQAQFVTPGFDIITAGRWAGRWDIAIASITPTEKRAEVLDFPVVYYAAAAALIVNKDNRSITKAEDASGKRIGAQGASTHEYYLNGTLKLAVEGAPPVIFKIKNPKIIAYDSEGLAMDDLRLGDGTRLDAAVASVQAINGAIAAGYPIRQVGSPLFAEPLAAALDKGDPEFSAKVKEVITAMRNDGTMSALSKKWFGVDYSILAN